MRAFSADPFLPDSEQEASELPRPPVRFTGSGTGCRRCRRRSASSGAGRVRRTRFTLALLVFAIRRSRSWTACKQSDLHARLWRRRPHLLQCSEPDSRFGSRQPVTFPSKHRSSDVLRTSNDLRCGMWPNGRARGRAQSLMDVANSCRGLVVGTGMSEDALGWCTFGGDHLAKLNVNVCLSRDE